jgi:hypothetical protein
MKIEEPKTPFGTYDSDEETDRDNNNKKNASKIINKILIR